MSQPSDEATDLRILETEDAESADPAPAEPTASEESAVSDESAVSESAVAEDSAAEESAVSEESAVAEDSAPAEESAVAQESTVSDESAVAQESAVSEESAVAEDGAVAEDSAASDESAVLEESADSDADPLVEFRERLHSQIGDWYVVHTYSGMEKRVKANLENRVTSLNMEDFIHEVVVPTEDVWEVKNGQRKKVSRTVLPGYVLVRMDLTDESWSAVRHTPSVTGFVGHSHQPVPLSLDEVEAMLAPTIVEEQAAPEQKQAQKVEFTDFSAGDSVLIVDGAFATLHATLTEIN